MRLIFICQECGTHYLPPESMRYEAAGEDASAVWCSACQAVMRERGIEESPVAAAVALLAARSALRDRIAESPEARLDVRPSRPARTQRSGQRPAGARTKLG